MNPSVQNLYHPLPEATDAEAVSLLLRRDGLRVERIVSDGHASPDGFWYQQHEDEWVCLLEGSASLEFEGHPWVPLGRGDWLLIPAGLRHRVAVTSRPAVWLAVFVPPAMEGGASHV